MTTPTIVPRGLPRDVLTKKAFHLYCAAYYSTHGRGTMWDLRKYFPDLAPKRQEYRPRDVDIETRVVTDDVLVAARQIERAGLGDFRPATGTEGYNCYPSLGVVSVNPAYAYAIGPDSEGFSGALYGLRHDAVDSRSGENLLLGFHGAWIEGYGNSSLPQRVMKLGVRVDVRDCDNDRVYVAYVTLRDLQIDWMNGPDSMHFVGSIVEADWYPIGYRPDEGDPSFTPHHEVESLRGTLVRLHLCPVKLAPKRP